MANKVQIQKVCDLCGATVVKGSARMLWKSEGQDTLGFDFCPTCIVKMAKVLKENGVDVRFALVEGEIVDVAEVK